MGSIIIFLFVGFLWNMLPPIKIVADVCPHYWRIMTSEKDYGNGFSPDFGGYTGSTQEKCIICRVKRQAQSWNAWKHELDRAESRVKYLKDIEPRKQ